MSRHIYLFRDGEGYTQIHDKEKTGFVRLHQLNAVAAGKVEPQKLFCNDDTIVHHKNGCPFDNRPGNLEVVSKSEHRRIHANESDESTATASA